MRLDRHLTCIEFARNMHLRVRLETVYLTHRFEANAPEFDAMDTRDVFC